MPGIFGNWQNNAPPAQPQVTAQPSLGDMQLPSVGNWWNTSNPDGSSSYLGGLLNYKPVAGQTGADRMGILGSTLQDVGASLGGQPQYAQHLRQTLADQIAQQQKALKGEALNDYATATTPQARQSAMVKFWAAGGDTAGLGSAMKAGNPELRDIPADGSLAVIDPISGLPTNVLHGTPKTQRPLISNGMQSLDNGNSWQPIPGYVQQQNAVAGARRGPPKAAATGAINIPHPSSMY